MCSKLLAVVITLLHNRRNYCWGMQKKKKKEEEEEVFHETGQALVDFVNRVPSNGTEISAEKLETVL